MKKFILICRHYLAEILFALVSLIICVAGLFFTSRFDILFCALIASVVAYVVAKLFLIKREKPQGSFTASIEGDSKDDPLPEPAEKLPYVYYNKPVEQEAHTIRYYSPYLGKVMEIPFRPRKIRGKSFDNVRGIVVADNLILLRSILFTANFPDDIREIAKQHEGRLPNRAEIEQIYAKFDEINQNLYECGEPLLKRRKYLYTCGNEADDRLMNYCLNFATGEDSCADCDSLVCAVLVETA